MSRVCLINPLGNDVGLICSPPLGLAYVAAVLEQSNHSVKIIDRVSMLGRNQNNGIGLIDIKMQALIQDFEPDIIGIGVMSIQVYDLGRILKIIRRTPGLSHSLVVVGGFHATAEPELTLREFPEIDLLCRGEGEFTLLELASRKDIHDIRGLSYRLNGEIHHTEDRVPERDIDTYPFPARHLIDMNYYLRMNDAIISCVPAKAITQLTSRGCPYNCKFCSSKSLFKTQRYHSVDYVIREIHSMLEQYKFDHISFVDSTMLPRKDRLTELCTRLIDEKLNKRFKWGCSLRPDLVNKEMLKLMKHAGCIFVNYGFESGSQRMLDAVNKKDKVEDNHTAAKFTTEAGILVNSAFIVNLPDEQEDDIRKTIEFIKTNRKYIYSTGINALLPLPGSPYYRELLECGVLKHSEKLWGEIAVLPKSIETTMLYSSINRSKFIDLFTEASAVANKINIINYIKRNLLRHPIFVIKKALNVLRGK